MQIITDDPLLLIVHIQVDTHRTNECVHVCIFPLVKKNARYGHTAISLVLSCTHTDPEPKEAIMTLQSKHMKDHGQ